MLVANSKWVLLWLFSRRALEFPLVIFFKEKILESRHGSEVLEQIIS